MLNKAQEIKEREKLAREKEAQAIEEIAQAQRDKEALRVELDETYKEMGWTPPGWTPPPTPLRSTVSDTPPTREGQNDVSNEKRTRTVRQAGPDEATSPIILRKRTSLQTGDKPTNWSMVQAFLRDRVIFTIVGVFDSREMTRRVRGVCRDYDVYLPKDLSTSATLDYWAKAGRLLKTEPAEGSKTKPAHGKYTYEVVKGQEWNFEDMAWWVRRFTAREVALPERLRKELAEEAKKELVDTGIRMFASGVTPA